MKNQYVAVLWVLSIFYQPKSTKQSGVWKDRQRETALLVCGKGANH